MNDMRLPGVGWLNNDMPSHEGGGEPARDPAQAFDAVMSRFSNERTNQRGTAAPPDRKKPDAASRTEDAAAGARSKTPQAPSRATQPDAKPVARTKAQDDAPAQPADAADAAGESDPATLVAEVTESAQLAAKDPAHAVADPALTPHVEAKPAQSNATAPELLASHAAALMQRAADAVAEGEQVAHGATKPSAPGNATSAPKGRSPAAAKDTLRIEAPLMRPVDAAQAEGAQRFATLTQAMAQATPDTRAAAHAATPDLAAQALSAAVGNTGTTYSMAHATIGTPVGAAGFASELAQRVVIFTGQKVQRAEISVTPADLGPIAVSIEVRGQEATLAFAASSHTTRVAIEDALPRLRDMLAQQGLQLSGTHVGSEPRRDPYRPASAGKNAHRVGETHDTTRGVSAVSGSEIRRRVNLIDIEV